MNKCQNYLLRAIPIPLECYSYLTSLSDIFITLVVVVVDVDIEIATKRQTRRFMWKKNRWHYLGDEFSKTRERAENQTEKKFLASNLIKFSKSSANWYQSARNDDSYERLSLVYILRVKLWVWWKSSTFFQHGACDRRGLNPDGRSRFVCVLLLTHSLRNLQRKPLLGKNEPNQNKKEKKKKIV